MINEHDIEDLTKEINPNPLTKPKVIQYDIFPELLEIQVDRFSQAFDKAVDMIIGSEEDSENV